MQQQDAANSSGTRGSDRMSGSSDISSYSGRESESYRRSYRDYSIGNSQNKADEVDRNIDNIDVSEDEAPERAITLFAFRLAILEKTASGLGAAAFIWATVVLLGGFSVYVSVVEFWVVSALLVTEGTRIFFRSHELECQQLGARSNFSIVVAGIRVAHAGSSLAHRSERAVRGGWPFYHDCLLLQCDCLFATHHLHSQSGALQVHRNMTLEFKRAHWSLYLVLQTSYHVKEIKSCV